MTRLFNIPSFRLLALGGAKARTNDDTGVDFIEHDDGGYE